MRYRIFFYCLMAIIFGTVLSCEKVENESDLLTLDLKVANVTSASVNVEVTASNEQGMYYFSVAEKSEVEASGSQEMYVKERLHLLKSQGKLEINKGNSSKTFDGLKASAEYVAFAVALDGEMDASEEMEFSEFVTRENEPEEDLDWESVKFEISVDNLSASNADLNVVASDNEIPFFYDVVSEKVYTAYRMNTKDGIADYINLLFEGLAEKYGLSVEELYDELIAYGEGKRNYTTLPANSKMYAYAVAVDLENGSAVAKTKSTVYEFMTPEPEESDLQISFNTLKEAPFAGRIEFIPSDDNAYYFYEFWEAENIEFYGLDDQGVIDHFVEYWGDYFDVLKVHGKQTYYREDMLQNTEYVAIAFGLENGRPNTKLFKHYFKTLPGIKPEEQTFDIRIENEQAVSVEIYYEPWDPTVTYAFEIIPKKDYDEASDKKAFLQEYYNELIDYYVSQTPFTREQAIEILSQEGSYIYECSYLNPGTEYYAWAVAIDKKDATFLSDIAMAEFSTTDMEYSDVKAVAAINEYFDGDELAAMDPTFESYAGSAIYSFDVEISGDVKDWYVGLIGGDVTDTGEYPDSQLYAQVIGTGVKNPSSYDVFGVQFDTDFTLCSFAVDNSGKYGPMHRKTYRLTRAGASPAEDFISYSPSGIMNPAPLKSFPSREISIPYAPEDKSYDLRDNLRGRLEESLMNIKSNSVITAKELFQFNENLVK